MQFLFQVSVETERVSGPFASRDDLEAEIIEAIDGADPGSLQPGDNEYEVQVWETEALPVGKAAKRPKPNPELLAYLRGMRQRLDEALAGPDESPDRRAAVQAARNMLDGLFAKLTEAKVIKP